MRTVILGFVVSALAACATDAHRPQTIAEVHQQSEWQHDPGAALQAAMADDVSRIARKEGRAGAITQLEAAGYECQYGEAHTDYPEPMAVCTRSFATRACQFDWKVVLTSDPARLDSVDATNVDFTRDCVDTADDWPVPVNSAIDDQLAPAPKVTETY